MAILGAYLVIHFFRRFRVAFSPSTVFADFGGVIGSVWGEMQKSESLTPRQHLDPETDEYNKEIAQRLLNVYLMAGVLCFIGERLREVVKSRKLDLYFLCSLLYTFLLLTLIFSIAYFGLERISPGSFIGISEANLLEFLGFSFSTLMTSDISPIKPVSGPAQVGTYLQLFSSLLIAVLLVFVILTSIRERYKQDLDNLVNEFRAASEKFDGFVEINYELTVVSAEILLFKFNPDVTKWCLKVMRGETRAREISESVDRAT